MSSSDSKLVAAIDRLSKEIARNTAGTERARVESAKVVKSLEKAVDAGSRLIASAPSRSLSGEKKRRRAA